MHQKTQRLQTLGFLFTTFLEELSEHDDPFRLPGTAGRLDGDPDDVLGSVYGLDHHDAASGGGMIDDRLPARWRCLWRTATFVQWYLVLVASTHNDVSTLFRTQNLIGF
jgi:hypothetical protein